MGEPGSIGNITLSTFTVKDTWTAQIFFETKFKEWDLSKTNALATNFAEGIKYLYSPDPEKAKELKAYLVAKFMTYDLNHQNEFLLLMDGFVGKNNGTPIATFLTGIRSSFMIAIKKSVPKQEPRSAPVQAPEPEMTVYELQTRIAALRGSSHIVVDEPQDLKRVGEFIKYYEENLENLATAEKKGLISGADREGLSVRYHQARSILLESHIPRPPVTQKAPAIQIGAERDGPIIYRYDAPDKKKFVIDYYLAENRVHVFSCDDQGRPVKATDMDTATKVLRKISTVEGNLFQIVTHSGTVTVSVNGNEIPATPPAREYGLRVSTVSDALARQCKFSANILYYSEFPKVISQVIGVDPRNIVLLSPEQPMNPLARRINVNDANGRAVVSYEIFDLNAGQILDFVRFSQQLELLFEDAVKTQQYFDQNYRTEVGPNTQLTRAFEIDMAQYIRMGYKKFTAIKIDLPLKEYQDVPGRGHDAGNALLASTDKTITEYLESRRLFGFRVTKTAGRLVLVIPDEYRGNLNIQELLNGLQNKLSGMLREKFGIDNFEIGVGKLLSPLFNGLTPEEAGVRTLLGINKMETESASPGRIYKIRTVELIKPTVARPGLDTSRLSSDKVPVFIDGVSPAASGELAAAGREIKYKDATTGWDNRAGYIKKVDVMLRRMLAGSNKIISSMFIDVNRGGALKRLYGDAFDPLLDILMQEMIGKNGKPYLVGIEEGKSTGSEEILFASESPINTMLGRFESFNRSINVSREVEISVDQVNAAMNRLQSRDPEVRKKILKGLGMDSSPERLFTPEADRAVAECLRRFNSFTQSKKQTDGTYRFNLLELQGAITFKGAIYELSVDDFVKLAQEKHPEVRSLRDIRSEWIPELTQEFVKRVENLGEQVESRFGVLDKKLTQLIVQESGKPERTISLNVQPSIAATRPIEKPGRHPLAERGTSATVRIPVSQPSAQTELESLNVLYKKVIERIRSQTFENASQRDQFLNNDPWVKSLQNKIGILKQFSSDQEVLKKVGECESLIQTVRSIPFEEKTKVLEQQYTPPQKTMPTLASQMQTVTVKSLPMDPVMGSDGIPHNEIWRNPSNIKSQEATVINGVSFWRRQINGVWQEFRAKPDGKGQLLNYMNGKWVLQQSYEFNGRTGNFEIPIKPRQVTRPVQLEPGVIANEETGQMPTPKTQPKPSGGVKKPASTERTVSTTKPTDVKVRSTRPVSNEKKFAIELDRLLKERVKIQLSENPEEFFRALDRNENEIFETAKKMGISDLKLKEILLGERSAYHRVGKDAGIGLTVNLLIYAIEHRGQVFDTSAHTMAFLKEGAGGAVNWGVFGGMCHALEKSGYTPKQAMYMAMMLPTLNQMRNMPEGKKGEEFTKMLASIAALESPNVGLEVVKRAVGTANFERFIGVGRCRSLVGLATLTLGITAVEVLKRHPEWTESIYQANPTIKGLLDSAATVGSSREVTTFLNTQVVVKILAWAAGTGARANVIAATVTAIDAVGNYFVPKVGVQIPNSLLEMARGDTGGVTTTVLGAEKTGHQGIAIGSGELKTEEQRRGFLPEVPGNSKFFNNINTLINENSGVSRLAFQTLFMLNKRGLVNLNYISESKVREYLSNPNPDEGYKKLHEFVIGNQDHALEVSSILTRALNNFRDQLSGCILSSDIDQNLFKSLPNGKVPIVELFITFASLRKDLQRDSVTAAKIEDGLRKSGKYYNFSLAELPEDISAGFIKFLQGPQGRLNTYQPNTYRNRLFDSEMAKMLLR